MKNILLSRWPHLVIRTAIGIIFIYAGAVKLLDFNGFARSIDQYDLVPDLLLPAVAVGLPAFEVIAGLGLILDIPGSLISVFSMLVMFVLVLGYGIINDMDVDCGCFSTEEAAARGSLKQALFRDLALIAAVLCLFASRRMRSPSSQRPSVWAKFGFLKGGN